MTTLSAAVAGPANPTGDSASENLRAFGPRPDQRTALAACGRFVGDWGST